MSGGLEKCARDDVRSLEAQLEMLTLKPKPSAKAQFAQNLPKYAFGAFVTVPIECLAIDRVRAKMNAAHVQPSSYYEVMQSKGFKVFVGWWPRMTYCLLGNFSTIWGREHFGDTYVGLFLTSICKQILLPVSLWSNAGQFNYSFKQSIECIKSDSQKWVPQIGFFARNFFSNMGLGIGLDARRRYYDYTGNSNQAQAVGFGVSLAATSVFNAAIKPWFIYGNYPWKLRLRAGFSLPALGMTAARELFSTITQYAGTPKLGDSHA
ncbi:MAG: hypothetical protein LLF94_05190 [Chlamydiales bacterium]|nr:hypothetical protein [Chlamydiales bacterium]